ncbi:two-component system, NarL family, sensor histidine kinase DesK [Friedmanniella luteola]|uniref:Two-component system, NarL family, sensor histidine kinase DesK n=1 Tax=Friedmanniella luteola TaxID=546871 RepID=A0A1H1PH17_9ACTN|nr:histidine kinase [Friedmanniella luteola]SDS10536.1 two-component system, NarL family, sensor histidine kinase DesK [Friedmanniella luteola]
MSSTSSLGTDTRRLELYIRSSLYVLLLCEPLLLVTAFVDRPALAVVAVLHTAANSLVCRWSMTGRQRPSFRLGALPTAGLVGWAVLSLGLAAATADATLGDLPLPLAVVVVGTSLGSIACALRHRVLVAAALVGAVASGLALVGLGGVPAGSAVPLVVACALLLLGLVYTFWSSGWMVRVVRELVEARHRAAQLAVAEERLRISRDLHDLFGRTLAAVAVKSALAGELLRRDRPEQAADEIAAVRALAEQAGGEVRQVVRGVRRVDLAEELAGARALLDSAGIRCVVHAAGAERLAPDAAAALAWTLREAVTNVIRHSRAGECVITLAAEDPVRLVVTNDGAPVSAAPSGPGGRGTGLAGMAERLAAVDGELVRHHAGGRFTVEARLPAARAHRAEVPA